jgi:hypothetical protein
MAQLQSRPPDARGLARLQGQYDVKLGTGRICVFPEKGNTGNSTPAVTQRPPGITDNCNR